MLGAVMGTIDNRDAARELGAAGRRTAAAIKRPYGNRFSIRNPNPSHDKVSFVMRPFHAQIPGSTKGCPVGFP